MRAGRAGAGKSTATADLAAVAAEHWSRPEAGRLRVPSCPIYWLDADQKDSKLVRKLFVTAKAVADSEGIGTEDRGYRLAFNVGPDASNSVPHLHLHVLGGRPLDWPPG